MLARPRVVVVDCIGSTVVLSQEVPFGAQALKPGSYRIPGYAIKAAELGYIDEIIRPKETRRRIAVLLEALKDKAETRFPKKHNNIPL